MTYRIAVAGTFFAAVFLMAGCASTAPKPVEAQTVEAGAETPAKPQPKVLQRPAPTAKEIESPLKAGEGEQLPILAQGDTPVGEGGTPRAVTPAVPPAHPGNSPGVEEVIEMPTKDLHGAFPGVGASTKNAAGNRSNDAVNQRIAEIEKQLLGLKEASAKPAGPTVDPAAIAAVQARLDELNAKLGKVETSQQELVSRPASANTGVPAERVEGIEKQLDALKGAIQSRDDASNNAKERAAADKAIQDKLASMDAQIDALGKAMEKGKAAPQAKRGVSSDEMAKRLQAMQEQLDTLQAHAAAQPNDNGVEKRFDELSKKVAALESGQQNLLSHPAPNSGVAPERVEGLEKELAGLKAAMATRNDASTKKDRASANKAYEERLDGLDRQIESLGKALADAKSAPSTQGVPSAELMQRLQAMQQQIDAMQSRPASAPDTAAEKRLDDLNDKVAALEKSQQDLAARPQPVSTGVSPERVAAIEKQLADLRTTPPAKKPSGATTAQEHDDFYKSFADQMKDLEKQIAGLDESVSKAATETKPGGMASDELARRVQKMQEQLDAVEKRVGAPETAKADPALQTRIDELASKISGIQQEEAARPAPGPAEVPEARFKKIEQQIDDIHAAMQSPKASAPSDEAMNQRFTALEGQLEGLRTTLDTQSKQLASAKEKGAAKGEAPPHNRARQEPGEYRLGSGDVVEFESFNDDNLSRDELTVRFDGHISLPLVPDIAVANLTRAEAEERIREEYKSVFRDPQISLIVKEAASKSYTVVGDIENPGVYPFTTDTDLIEAISMAGGLRKRSSSSSVGGFVGVTGQLTKAFVVRTVNGERQVLQYDMRGLGKAGAHDSEAPIYYGDLIYIPEGVNLVYLLGESRNPVIVELTEGMKLLQLLALSGGFNSSTAKLNGVVLMREVDENTTRILKVNVKDMLRGGKDFPLVPGDIVYIPRKRLVALQEFVQRFTGSISPVLELYTSAVNAYYAKDLQQSLIHRDGTNSTLQTLSNLESFGTSTANIVDLFGKPAK